MKLPKLPYKGDKTRKSVTKFLGINYTENTQEGQFVDSLGLSTENYPVLSQREDREELTTYSGVTDLFEWNGKFVVVDGGKLYFDNVLISSVTPGKKQFAVVNTHLIVMPDGLDIDISGSTYTFTYLTGGYTSKDGRAGSATTSTFSSGNTIQASSDPYLGATGIDHGVYTSWLIDGMQPCWYVYGNSISAVRACWTGTAWDMTSLNTLRELVTAFGDYGDRALQTGDIMIPTVTGQYFSNSYGWVDSSGVTTYPSQDYTSNTGFVMVVDDDNIPSEQKSGSVWSRDAYVEYFQNVLAGIWSASANYKFSDEFDVGELVTVDTNDDTYDVEEAKIISFDDSTNSVVIKAYDENAGTWTADAFPSTTKTFQAPITMKRNYPTLDFICERGNRLWGVSNDTKTIYASALGIPKNMTAFEDNDADPYSVAVGSEGDFTGIISYGNATLCFKENSLTKVLGDYPSNFYTTEYKIAGLQEGSEKSLQIVNETLLYKGTQGVYSFTGSTPSLISQVLGRDVYTNAVAGHDGERYYISMDKGTEHNLFTYDLINGLWMKEDSIKADAFTRYTDFYMASGGYVYKLNQSGDKDFDWYAELAPFYTMARSSSSYTQTIGKQNNTKIILLLEMESGSRLQVFVKEDNKQYRLAYTQSPTRKLSITVPIRVGRCDVFHVKLKGHGSVKIRQMLREYNIGSER